MLELSYGGRVRHLDGTTGQIGDWTKWKTFTVVIWVTDDSEVRYSRGTDLTNVS